jgi:hypothetical protein
VLAVATVVLCLGEPGMAATAELKRWAVKLCSVNKYLSEGNDHWNAAADQLDSAGEIPASRRSYNRKVRDDIADDLNLSGERTRRYADAVEHLGAPPVAAGDNWLDVETDISRSQAEVMKDASDEVRAFPLNPSAFQSYARGFSDEIRRRMTAGYQDISDVAARKWAKTGVRVLDAQNCA